MDNEENVASETIYLDDYSIIQENTYSGRLANTPVGIAEDPLYGNMRSVALLKPSISTSNVDTIRENDTVSLRLIFNEEIYGDSLATSNYEIYEVGRIWRGAQLRYNEEVPVDKTTQIAQFQVRATQDTVTVDLSEFWQNKYAQYFNSDTDISSAERDSIYINNFPGLAIVPAEGNQNIRFLKTQVSGNDSNEDDEEELITSFLYDTMVVDEDDDEEASGPDIITVRDWGASFTRQGGSDAFGNFYLHNSERALRIEPDLPEDLASKNIVNAQLILSKNNSPQKNTAFVARPNTNLIRAHVFDEDPNDVMAEIFTTEPSFSASIGDTSNAFLMNITQFVLNDVYGDVKDRKIYVTLQSVNGLIYSSYFFDPNSTDIRKPRIVITYVKE